MSGRPAAPVAGAAPKIGRIGRQEITHVLGELSDLLEAGCPLSRALTVLRRQAARPSVRRLLDRLGDDIMNGSSFADAMARADGLFNPVHVAMVRASEAGGFLQKTLAHIAEFGRRRQELAHRVRGMLTYPAILSVTAVASVAFLLGFVVPRFTRVYVAAGATLPWPTRLLMAVSDAVAEGWWAALATIALLVLLARMAIRHEPLRRRTDRLLLQMPLAGPFLREWALGEFFRSVGLLLTGGVTVLSSLRLVERAMGNRVIRSCVADLAEGVEQGEPMGRRMADAKVFAPATVELVAIAEQSGSLPSVMTRLAAQSQRRLEARLGVLVAMVEPAVVVVVGGLVALIVAGMLLPVLLMSTLVE
ncbi:MAG: type II secretion system F family protein [Planctomycetes bacterium]|nr:type II secretion system F family protein [Planctomycetota bacterium]